MTYREATAIAHDRLKIGPDDPARQELFTIMEAQNKSFLDGIIKPEREAIYIGALMFAIRYGINENRRMRAAKN